MQIAAAGLLRTAVAYRRVANGRGLSGGGGRGLEHPERFAQQALGHNSKAMHHAYSKHAEVTVPSLDDWEKEWGNNSQHKVQPKLLPVDFRSPVVGIERESSVHCQ
jgi:hypothetical protein